MGDAQNRYGEPRQLGSSLLPNWAPCYMSEEQKKNKVRNLLQELRRDGRIKSAGKRSESRWIITKSVGEGEP